jgi:translation initiation factor 2B subunit (eIF-2B alpha/beta/delta family)
MIAEEVRRALEEIRRDDRSGAAALAEKTVEVFSLYHSTTEPRTRCYRDLRALALELAEAQPGMASVANVAWMAAEGLRLVSWKHYPAFLEGLLSRLRRSAGLVGRTGRTVVPPNSRVVTLSRSGGVLEVLRAAGDRVREVVVLESRPGLEGRRFARDILSCDIPVILVVDAAGPAEVSDSDAVLLGADAILRDGGLINKVGSLSLALSGKESGVPVWAVAEAFKLDVRHTVRSPPVTKEGDPREVFAEPVPSLKVRNRYYDILPPRLLSGVAWEGGVGAAKDLVERFKGPKALLDYYHQGGGTAGDGRTGERPGGRVANG